MRGHRVRIYPTSSQEEYLVRIFGHCRFTYNELLRRNIALYEAYRDNPSLARPNVSSVGLTKEVTVLKHEYDWLNEVPMEALQQKARDLGKAFSKFFDGLKSGSVIGFPRFRKKYIHDSFRLHDRYFSIKDGGLRLSRFSTDIKVRWDRRGEPHKPSQVTITRDRSGRWYASFLTEYHDTRTHGVGTIGIDLGLTTLASLSTGESIDNPKYFHKHLRVLRRRHRQHSRTKKGSSNREKKRLQLAKAYAKVSDCRHDYLHKLSTRLINENQVICLETLNVKGMVRNRRLSRHIMDSAWSTLTTMLAYKARESGANIVLVDRWYPSTQTCSFCNHRLESDEKLTLKDRGWVCPSCGTTHDRDHNAALNILKEGLARVVEIPPGAIAIV